MTKQWPDRHYWKNPPSAEQGELEREARASSAPPHHNHAWKGAGAAGVKTSGSGGASHGRSWKDASLEGRRFEVGGRRSSSNVKRPRGRSWKDASRSESPPRHSWKGGQSKRKRVASGSRGARPRERKPKTSEGASTHSWKDTGNDAASNKSKTVVASASSHALALASAMGQKAKLNKYEKAALDPAAMQELLRSGECNCSRGCLRRLTLQELRELRAAFHNAKDADKAYFLFTLHADADPDRQTDRQSEG